MKRSFPSKSSGIDHPELGTSSVIICCDRRRLGAAHHLLHIHAHCIRDDSYVRTRSCCRRSDHREARGSRLHCQLRGSRMNAARSARRQCERYCAQVCEGGGGQCQLGQVSRVQSSLTAPPRAWLRSAGARSRSVSLVSERVFLVFFMSSPISSYAGTAAGLCRLGFKRSASATRGRACSAAAVTDGFRTGLCRIHAAWHSAI
jgi:hypothetical protein